RATRQLPNAEYSHSRSVKACRLASRHSAVDNFATPPRGPSLEKSRFRLFEYSMLANSGSRPSKRASARDPGYSNTPAIHADDASCRPENMRSDAWGRRETG